MGLKKQGQPDTSTVVGRILELKRKGESPTQFAKRLGVSSQVVWNWENADQKTVDSEKLALVVMRTGADLAAHYDKSSRRLVFELADETIVSRPIASIQGIAEASADELAEIVILPPGDVLEFPAVDAHVSVPALLLGITGGRSWMQEIGRAGGSVTSKAKKRAAARNGRKGGRPKKAKTESE